MTITLVVAAAENNAIGLKGKLLWHLPKDLKFFKNVTWGMPVIMGRKTFEALGKPLAGRTNIVITHQPHWKAEGAVVVKGLYEALKVADDMFAKEVMVIGGGEIYKSFFFQAERIYITRVHAKFEADTFFPEIDPEQWQLVSNVDMDKDEKHPYSFSFQKWERKGLHA
ncbi:MAG: dihydrofolate reductase [Bacteroidetes bacterium]|nr:dihydrofolate reductase [Bacteroidota bacterium]